MNLFETHAHLYFPHFQNYAQEIAACNQAGVTHQIQIGCDEISSLAALKMAQDFDGIYCALGLHPCDVLNVGRKDPNYHRYAGLIDYELQCHNYDELFAWFEGLYLDNKDTVVAFGETGFDLYHNDSSEIFLAQKDSFHRHLQLCHKYQKPVIIHNRQTRDEFLEFWTDEVHSKYDVTGVVHCLAEDAEYALKVTNEFGLYVGVGGVATYPKAEIIREAIKAISLDKIVIETDSPFLTPRKAKNKRNRYNSPQFLPEIVQCIADLKETTPEAVAEITFKNACRLFGVQ